ncbi:MAG TPA: O-methyltransferase, partial [Nitrososphaera sp.]|nr:O-methyltransferase [Nitrososphaera sp.]
LIFPMVRVGGIIAADNILYPEDCVPEMTKYSKYVKNRSDVESVTVPIGNGEEITIKLRP